MNTGNPFKIRLLFIGWPSNITGFSLVGQDTRSRRFCESLRQKMFVIFRSHRIIFTNERDENFGAKVPYWFLKGVRKFISNNAAKKNLLVRRESWYGRYTVVDKTLEERNLEEERRNQCQYDVSPFTASFNAYIGERNSRVVRGPMGEPWPYIDFD